MNLQDLISNSELIMTVPQVKAFFLGVLSAEKPMPFDKAVDELLAAFPEDKTSLAPELKILWEELKSKRGQELANMFPKNKDVKEFLETSKEQLDYFLTAMSLSGTNVETMEDEDLIGLIEELEELVMDLDEWLVDEKHSLEEGEEMKEFLLETWKEFVGVKQ